MFSPWFQLLAPRSTPWRLTGIAEGGDPLLVGLGPQDQGEPFTALDLNCATLVALEAAGDNGASECETWLVLEGNHLQTRPPHIPVLIEVSTASSEWADPSKNPAADPVLLAVAQILGLNHWRPTEQGLARLSPRPPGVGV